jgi:hypothetical protein
MALNPSDFLCRVCGKECPLAPDPPEKAVCEDHCEDHHYVYVQGERRHGCEYCGADRPYDWDSD